MHTVPRAWAQKSMQRQIRVERCVPHFKLHKRSQLLPFSVWWCAWVLFNLGCVLSEREQEREVDLIFSERIIWKQWGWLGA